MLFPYAIGTVQAIERDSCSHTTVTQVSSPDGSWSAILDEAVCDGGLGTSVVDSVRVASVHTPSRNTDILGIDTGGHTDGRPRLSWREPNILRVTVPNLSLLKIFHRNFETVHIDVQFDPADPTARDAWLRKLGLPPDDTP